jgi:uncharacterized membrane protein YagU involved in acid resistance
LLGFTLVASHNLDNLFLNGFDPFPIIITLPYVVIAFIWNKVPKLAVTILLSIFAVLEFNHTITEHIPNLLEYGLERRTLSAMLFDLGVITWFGTLIVLYNQLFNKLREKKKASL